MANPIRTIAVRELREALPAIIFFLILFHMIGLTKAVVLDNYSLTALRSTAATMGALIVAKAILIVETLPIAKLASLNRFLRALWKTLLYGIVVLLFRILEELVPLIVKHHGIAAGARAAVNEVSWPLFGVLCLWIVLGLLLYCFISELVSGIGSQRARELFLSRAAK